MKCRSAINTIKPIISEWAGTQLSEIKMAGSFAKNTAIIGSTDIDLFISLKSDTTNTLKEVYKLLNERLIEYGYITKQQNVSIGIIQNGIKIDLVPGVKQSPLTGDHAIYKRKSDSWVKTNIDKHIRLIRSSGRLEEIKLLKIWRGLFNLEFPSFYLELTVIEALKGAIIIDGISNKVWKVFEYIATKFENARVVDPSNTGNVISDDLTIAEKKTISNVAKNSLRQRFWKHIIW